MRSVVLLILLSLARVAGAQPDDDAQVARQAFIDGTTWFNLGKWPQAIEAWERGYRAKPDPVFLYNIAQAYRLSENPERALFFYRNYLRTDANAPNREEVERRIAQLETLMSSSRDAREATPDRPLPPVVGAPPEVVSHPPPAPRPRRTHVEAGAGVNAWLAGLSQSATPSVVVNVAAGHALVRSHRLELRLGGAAAWSWLRDLTSTDHFISLWVDPSLRVRLFRERLFLRANLSLGVLLLAGVARGSVLLGAGRDGGVLAGFELRPALGLEVAALPWLRLALTLETGVSPRGSDRLASPVLARLMAGLSLSFLL